MYAHQPQLHTFQLHTYELNTYELNTYELNTSGLHQSGVAFKITLKSAQHTLMAIIRKGIKDVRITYEFFTDEEMLKLYAAIWQSLYGLSMLIYGLGVLTRRQMDVLIQSSQIKSDLVVSEEAVTHLDVSEKAVTHLVASEKSVTHPDVSEGAVTHLVASEKSVTHPDVSEGAVTHLDTTNPQIKTKTKKTTQMKNT